MFPIIFSLFLFVYTLVLIYDFLVSNIFQQSCQNKYLYRILL